jgi:hypothetical protein
MYASGYYDGITHLYSAVWSTDGTNEGTVILTPDCYNTSTGPQDVFENIGDSIYFQGQFNGCVNNFQLNKFTIPTKIWLGKNSTDWNNANNWDPAGVPSNTDDIVIPGGITNYPVISANAVARNLWINWGSVNVASGVQLTVNGELSVIGNLTGDGSLVMAAAGNDNFSGNGAVTISSIIINGSDVTLKGNKEIKQLQFLSNNKIYLGENNLVVTNNSNAITGYNENRFIVTNGSGSLTQKNIGSTPVVFPVGASAASYNPLTITNSGDADDYKVRVIPSVYEDGNTGAAISSQAVNRTWFMEEGLGGGSDVMLKVQWNTLDQLTGFNKNGAYLSHYINNAWDLVPAGVVSGANPFTLTRDGFTSFSPFAVFSTGSADSDNDGTPDASDCAPNDNTRWRTANFYIDNDGDGYDAGQQQVCYGTNVPAGYAATTLGSDCNDNSAAIHPGVVEICDGIDNNCNGVIDEGVKTTFYRDADADGYGNPSITVQVCSLPTGYVSNSTDCNDGDASVYPGATEICDGKDNNCDGQVDNNVQTITYYRDADADGYGTSSNTLQACSPPAGYVSISGDCNDNNAAIKPGAIEICDGLDNDCDVQIDEGVKTTFYRDADNDGFGNAGITIQACSIPSGYVTNNTDCNDNNSAIKPGATEVCGNNVDDDCDGLVDEGCNTTNLPKININNTSVEEGNNGSRNATFVLRLSKRSNTPVTVQYQTANNTAIAPGDYTQKSGTVTFPSNDLVQNIVVQVKGDKLNEINEKFTVRLSNAINGAIADDNAVCTIRDDDPEPAIRIRDITATESSQQALVRVDLSAASGQIIRVKYDTKDGSAKAPGDYIAISNGILEFQPGETTKYISIVVKQDALNESTERFEVRLKQPENATFGRRDAEVRIQNSQPVSNTLTKNAPATQSLTDNRRITVSPNPANQAINLRLFDKTLHGKLSVELVDQNGRIVKQWIKSYSAEGQSMDLPVADIASGIYIVVIKGDNGQRLTYKVVVQH